MEEKQQEKPQITTLDVFKNIWEYARYYKWMVFLIFFGIAVSSILGIGEFYVYKIFIDKITVFIGKNINFTEFLPEILYILLFYLIINLLNSWIFSASLFVMLRFEYDMQAKFSEAIFARLHKLSMRFHSNKKTGSILKKMTRGINALEIIIENLFFNVLPIIGKVVFFALLLIYFDWRISIITIAVISLSMIWSVILINYQQKFIYEENKADDNVHGIAADSLINYETVKYFANENYENTRYAEKLNEWVKKGKKAWIYGPLMLGGQETIFILGSIFILYLSVLNVIDNIFTIGDIVLVGAYLSNMAGLMDGLSYAYRNIKKSITDQKEIIKILKEESEINEIENSKVLGKVKGDILYKNVSFAYHNQNIIDDFNLNIKAGEKVAFVGSSGGGKSTLIVQLLPRFYDIQKGQILIDGIDIKTTTLKSLRQNIAIVSQESVLFNYTILCFSLIQ
ncbi:MAG: ABC transporter transmembrane domain-containing protein [Patescibacteria group bacterium]